MGSKAALHRDPNAHSDFELGAAAQYRSPRSPWEAQSWWLSNVERYRQLSFPVSHIQLHTLDNSIPTTMKLSSCEYEQAAWKKVRVKGQRLWLQ